jgi:hypothetical protein
MAASGSKTGTRMAGQFLVFTRFLVSRPLPSNRYADRYGLRLGWKSTDNWQQDSIRDIDSYCESSDGAVFALELESQIFQILKQETTHMPTTFDNEILAAAIEGFEAQKTRLDARIAEIRQKLGGGASSEEPAAVAPETGRKRRKMSAAARKRIADAQKKRWAAVRKESGSTAPAAKSEAAPKAKRRLSAAGRKRIIEATKKRWAQVRAAAAKEA